MTFWLHHQHRPADEVIFDVFHLSSICQRQPERDGAEPPGIRNHNHQIECRLSSAPFLADMALVLDGLEMASHIDPIHRLIIGSPDVNSTTKTCNPLVVPPPSKTTTCAHMKGGGKRPSPIGLLLDWAPLINADLRCALRTGPWKTGAAGWEKLGIMAHHDSSCPAWSCGIRARFSVSGRGCASSKHLCLCVRRPM